MRQFEVHLITSLRCENVEEKNIGRQMGWAVSGVSVGTTIVHSLIDRPLTTR